MLIRPHDAAMDDREWQEFLREHDFGQIIASGRDRPTPVIVPAHFVFDGERTVSLHLARPNPIWDALDENPLAVLAVIGAYTYIPTQWNAAEGQPPDHGIPTSYYAAIQATGACEIVDDPVELAAILERQLAHFQPEGGHAPVEPAFPPYGPSLRAIRGLRLTISEVRAKFKFGGNKPATHRQLIAEKLARRARGLDLEAREHLLRRTR
ncbi:MAG TPA: FMN-binding negative transcriptional regulator [Chloroflexota bacterium]|nr:FMN-binding negative transcriptional regulator [Chloroflexota bacterium]